MKPEDITSIEQRLGYTFKNKKLLIRALTRKAFAQEQRQQGHNCEDQEVYRILGDAALKLILVEMLIEKGYDSRNDITNKKIDLEKRESLGEMLWKMDLVSFIRFGLGEQKQGVSKQSSVLGETFEALIAAIHIDRGSYEATKKLVVKMFEEEIPNKPPQSIDRVKKSYPNETVQRLWASFNSCGHCMHLDICSQNMICMFDLSDD